MTWVFSELADKGLYGCMLVAGAELKNVLLEACKRGCMSLPTALCCGHTFMWLIPVGPLRRALLLSDRFLDAFPESSHVFGHQEQTRHDRQRYHRREQYPEAQRNRHRNHKPRLP